MLILLYGGFATGKTYAMHTFLEQYKVPDHVCVIHADNGHVRYWEDDQLVGERVEGWQGKIEVKSQLMCDCMADDTMMYIVESGRPDGEKYIAPYYGKIGGGARVVYALATWRIMKRFLQDRCIARDKKFNEDFWNFKNLQYNATYRMLYQAAEYLVPHHVPYRIFSVDYERRAWVNIQQHILQLTMLPYEDWYYDT